MIADVEVTKDGIHFRIINVEISEVSKDEGIRAMREARKAMEDDEDVYQVCAPCHGSTINQPFFDFLNGFRLLDGNRNVWGN